MLKYIAGFSSGVVTGVLFWRYWTDPKRQFKAEDYVESLVKYIWSQHKDKNFSAFSRLEYWQIEKIENVIRWRYCDDLEEMSAMLSVLLHLASEGECSRERLGFIFGQLRKLKLHEQAERCIERMKEMPATSK